MMFEVEDLTVASPATVSRCGMVYMEPESMGLKPLVDSWLQQIPENCRTKSKTFQENLGKLFDTFLEPCIEYLRHHLRETVTTKDNNLCQSLCRILDCYLLQYVDTELKKVTPEEIAVLESQIDSLFLYALIWSICCTVDAAGRVSFNEFLRAFLLKHPIKVALPEAHSVYDYRWDIAKKEWIEWNESYKGFEIDQKLTYGEIMIPTNDSTRNSYNMKLLLSNLKHVMFPGPTGTF